LLENNGPRYKDTEMQRLGLLQDKEYDGSPTTPALGDDFSILGGSPMPVDDEDGVVFGVINPALNEYFVDVTSTIARPGLNPYLIRGWFDTNFNSTFDHPGELFVNRIAMYEPGVYTERFLLDFNPDPEQGLYSRFRLTYIDDPAGLNGGVTLTTDILPIGEALGADGMSHGEVEDYGGRLYVIPEATSIVMSVTGALFFTCRRHMRARRPLRLSHLPAAVR
jgi:hypothetical protein